MDLLLALIALLTLLSFLLKSSFLPRPGALLTALGLALAVGLAIPWLTRQSAATVVSWTSAPDRMLDAAVCLVLEIALMVAFCFSRAAGKFRWLRYYPGLLVFPACCWAWAQLLFSRPGLDFGRLAWIAALVTGIVAFAGIGLLRKFIPEEETRLEGLFLINLFLLLLTVAATGAITF